MKGLIIYKGKYGATRQYAYWLKEYFNLPAIAMEKVTEKQIREARFILIGSSVYVGKIIAGKWLQKHEALLAGKKLFFFVVSATPANEKDRLQSYLQSAPVALVNKSNIHFLQGKMYLKELSWWDRFVLKMGARLQKDPAVRKKMLTDYNAIHHDALQPLINEVDNYLEPGLVPA